MATQPLRGTSAPARVRPSKATAAQKLNSRYFPSRTELLIATVRHVDEVAGAAERFEEAHQAMSGIEALEAWTRIWANYIPDIAPGARALLAARSYDQDAAKAWEDRMAALRNGPAHIAKRLNNDGSLRDELDVETAADLMWAIASVQVWDALTGDRGWSTAKYHKELRQTLRRTLTDHG
jgi:AcrR family transcriptional regulator